MRQVVRQAATIAGISATVTLPFAWASHHFWVTSGQFLFHDHLTALSIARALKAGADEVLSSTIYEPLPPVLLGWLLYLTDMSWLHTLPAYVLIHSCAATAAFLLARQFLTKRPSIWVGILVGLDPVLMATSGRMYAETVSSLLVTTALLALVKTYPTLRVRHILLVCALLATCILARIQVVAITGVVFLFLILVAWRHETRMKRWGRAATFAAALALCLSPLAYWNHRTTGTVRISPTRTMHTLCGGALAVRYSGPELVVSALSRFSTGAVEKVWGNRYRLMTTDTYCGQRWGQFLNEAGGNESAADQAMGKEVLEMILSAPGRYALWLALSPIPFLAFEHEAINYLRPGLDEFLPGPAIHVLSGLLWLYSIFIVALALRGTWFLVRERNAPGILVALSAWAYLAVHAPATGQYRFASTIIPILVLLAVVGATGRTTPIVSFPPRNR